MLSNGKCDNRYWKRIKEVAERDTDGKGTLDAAYRDTKDGSPKVQAKLKAAATSNITKRGLRR